MSSTPAAPTGPATTAGPSGGRAGPRADGRTDARADGRTDARADGRTARRAETREAILAAATELFAAHGVSSTSIEDIADRAGTAKGSVFYNFESKSGLVQALLERSIERLSATLTSETAGLHGVALRRATVRTLLREVHVHTDAARILLNEIFRTDRSWDETTAAWRAVTLRGLTEDYVAEHGEAMRPTASLWAAALVGATLTGGLQWLIAEPQVTYDEASEALLQVLHLT